MKRALFLLLVTVLLVAAPVYASDISNALYLGALSVTNTGTAATNVSANVTLSTANLVAGGYLDAEADNVAVRYNGADVAFMPAPGDTTNWIVWVDSIAADEVQGYALYTNATAAAIRWFPGTGGMTHSGNIITATQTWELEIQGYFNGSGNYILDANNGGTRHIQLTYGNVHLVLDSIASPGFDGTQSINFTPTGTGVHTLKVTSDATNFTVYWDGVQKAQAARTVNTTALNAYTYASNASMAYLEYVKIWLGATLTQHIAWAYDAGAPYVFADLSGNGNTTVPTFRLTSSDADVTGTLTSFQPIAESQAPAYSLGPSGNFIANPPGLSGNFTTTINPTDFPGKSILADIATVGSVPQQLLFLVLGAFLILCISLLVTWAFKHMDVANGAALFKALIVSTCIGVAIALDVFDWWMLILFAILIAAIASANLNRSIT